MVSTSPTVSVPAPVSGSFVSLRSAVSGPSVITGASFVPVIVIVTVSVSLRGVVGSSSTAFTVYSRINVSPAAR